MVHRILPALLVSVVYLAPAFAALPQAALQAAAKQGSPVLLLVTDPEAQNVESARSTVSAAAKQVNDCVTVELDRADATNAAFVTRYGLAGAPVPLILVFAGNGAIAGGVPSSQATSAALVSMIPTPKKAEVLQALQSGNAVFLVASRTAMKTTPKIMDSCALACNQLKGKATTVHVDLDDAAEQRFLAELRVDAAVDAPVTLVINPQGQIAGSFDGPVDVATLAQAAVKKAGGCCSKGGGGDQGCAKPKG